MTHRVTAHTNGNDGPRSICVCLFLSQKMMCFSLSCGNILPSHLFGERNIRVYELKDTIIIIIVIKFKWTNKKIVYWVINWIQLTVDCGHSISNFSSHLFVCLLNSFDVINGMKTYRRALCIWATTLDSTIVALIGWCTDWSTFVAWSWLWLSTWSWWWWWNICVTLSCWAWTWCWHTNLAANFWLNVTFLLMKMTATERNGEKKE